jgi:hypothetical protein
LILVVMPKNNNSIVLYACALALAAGSVELCVAQDSDTQRQLRELRQQNQALQEQLRQQQLQIESLTRKVTEIQNADSHSYDALNSQPSEDNKGGQVQPTGPLNLGKINISGEGGVAFFETGKDGMSPHGEFRVDEARLFVEAPVWGNFYFFSELNLITREASDLSLQLGELYLDVENVSQLWNRDRMLNLRFGRMYTPFGEEYQVRYAIDNPLISHSLSDIWGVDEGIELYGKLGNFTYAVAVQNGGPSGGRDFSSDKSVAGRIGFDPTSWLHLSASAMRTGDMKPPGDYWSELWFGNGWFMPIGSGRTTEFHANLVEGDIELRLPHGHLKAFGGYARYADNDPVANNGRDIYYYSVEAVQDLLHNLYAGVRFSQILVDKGYPIAGNGSTDEYLFSGEFAEEIWRLSLGLGYRWKQNLLTKIEYSFEHGKLVNGEQRNHEDLFAIEAAFKF